MLWATFGPKQTLNPRSLFVLSAFYVPLKNLIPAPIASPIMPSPIRQGHRARRRAALGWGSLTRSRHARDAVKAESRSARHERNRVRNIPLH